MKTATDIDQFSVLEKLASLTQLYLELMLPPQDALRAAAADLSEPEKPGSAYSQPPFLREAMDPIRKDIRPSNITNYPPSRNRKPSQLERENLRRRSLFSGLNCRPRNSISVRPSRNHRYLAKLEI